MNPDEETPATTTRRPLDQPKSEQTIRLLNFAANDPAQPGVALAEVLAEADWPGATPEREDTLHETFHLDEARPHEMEAGAFVLVSSRKETSEPAGRSLTERERTPGYPTAHAATYAAHLAALGGAFLSVVTAALQAAPDDEVAHIYRGMACRALKDWHRRGPRGRARDSRRRGGESWRAIFPRGMRAELARASPGRSCAERVGKTDEGDLPA
jgi:hypothetical protein